MMAAPSNQDEQVDDDFLPTQRERAGPYGASTSAAAAAARKALDELEENSLALMAAWQPQEADQEAGLLGTFMSTQAKQSEHSKSLGPKDIQEQQQSLSHKKRSVHG